MSARTKIYFVKLSPSTFIERFTVMSIFFLHIKCSSIQVYLASVSPPATIVHIEIYGYEKITVYSRALKPQWASSLHPVFQVTSIEKSLRLKFHLTSYVQVVFNPKFLYPMLNIAMTSSVFLTVAIVLERFVAVHFPIKYRAAMNHSR